MTVFDILFLLNAALVVLALLRMRPTALIIALNQAQTIRALGGIQLAGQPPSETFLPSWIFSQRNLDVAWQIFAIATVLLAISLVVQPRPQPAAKPQFPPLPRAVALGIGLYVLLMTISSESVLSHDYRNESGSVYGVSLGGLNAFIFSLLLYGTARRAQLGLTRPVMAFLVITGVMFLTCYSKGSTGLATGYGICAAMMIWPRSSGAAGRQALLAAAMVGAILLMAFVVRGVRSYVSDEGTAAVTRLLERTDEREASRQISGEGIEVSGNGTQYACHVLECVQLYEGGVNRHWVSMVNPFIYTFEPSFLLNALGWTRPLDAPWELGRYYNHGGGIYLLGELYWNGGYFCVLVMFSLLFILAFYCDTRFMRSPLWFMMCAQFAPNLFMGIGYGVAQTSRGAFNGLIMIGAYMLFPTFKLRSKLNTLSPHNSEGSAATGARTPR